MQKLRELKYHEYSDVYSMQSHDKSIDKARTKSQI